MLEGVVDAMKTSPEVIPVVLVGGGAVIAPDHLAGASKVVKPKWSGVANAIGAATALVGGTVDLVVSTEGRSKTQITDELSQKAIDAAVLNGALRQTVSVVEMDSFPLQYIADKSRMIVKAVGSFDYTRAADKVYTHFLDNDQEDIEDGEHPNEQKVKLPSDPALQKPALTKDFIVSYRPEIIQRQWLLSELDLEFKSTGCYILGTGGGGSPYQHFLRLRELKRSGAILRVVSPHDLKDDDVVACGGGKGSPQVSVEKPYGDE